VLIDPRAEEDVPLVNATIAQLTCYGQQLQRVAPHRVHPAAALLA
jgi:hypothetical protein